MHVIFVLSHVWLFETPWTVAHQAPLSLDSPGKNTEVGCHALLQGIFSDPEIEPASPALAGGFFTHQATWEALCILSDIYIHFLSDIPDT